MQSPSLPSTYVEKRGENLGFLLEWTYGKAAFTPTTAAYNSPSALPDSP